MIACSCGNLITAAEWLKLPKIERLQEDGDDGWLELRNCSCGSTMSVEYPYRGELAEIDRAGSDSKPAGGLSPHPSAGNFGMVI